MAIFERIEKFDFSDAEFKKEVFFNGTEKTFSAKVRLNVFPDRSERELLFSCPYFSIYGAKLHVEKDKEAFTLLERKSKVRVHADEKGFVYLLELEAEFLSPYQKEPWKTIVDLPLNLFDATKKEAYAYYDGVKLGWIYDEEERNCDYTFGALSYREDIKTSKDESIEVFFSKDVCARKRIAVERAEKSFSFYSPHEYNAWAGDVMNFSRDGVYHLLFLYDRHHHNSRRGGGAHSVRHFTTTDFADWTEQPPILEVDKEWKSAGTGTMFYQNGKYYFSHGFHTSRMIPYEYTASRLIDEQPKSKERITPVPYTRLQKDGLYPSGANYFVSEDGVRFSAGDCVFHISENPSIYSDEDGKLFMFGGYGSSGIWRANEISGEWVLDKTAEIPQSPLEPSTECPSMFSLNGYMYLIMGFTGYWKTDKNGKTYRDQAILGYDVYDGLCVPMVAKTEDGRLIMSGWVGGGGVGGWASVVVHRELIQGEDGRLFMKWLSELAPKKENLTIIAKDKKSVSIEERKSYYFEADIDANENTRLFVRFNGKEEAVLSIDSINATVQINDSKEPILPLYELVNQGKGNRQAEKVHYKGRNFSIGRVDTIQTPYKLKIQLYYEKKSDSVYLDCEIGEKRTIISNRADQRFSSVDFEIEEGEIKSSEVYAL